jgi:hypothetical protein
VKQLQNQAGLSAAQEKYALGAGELSTILLAKEIRATEVLLVLLSVKNGLVVF